MAALAAPPAAQRWFSGKTNRTPNNAPLRVLTAAATRLDLANKKEARRQRALRQGWQLEAWAYRDSIGELRYAVNFLANCTARMKIFPAAYPVGGESDNPIPLADIGDCPPEIVAACKQAMLDLGNGRLAISGLLHSLSTNVSVPGEAFLLGQEDPQTGTQTWTVRSIDEIVIYDDAYKLREVPMDPQGILGWVDLDPDFTVASRMWISHPRFRILADSPLRAIMDDCESLLILRRMIRSTGRSRLAGRGLLLIPNELSIAVPNDDDQDPQSDPFMNQLAQAMLEPIGDEGAASAVVPLVARGPGESLAQIRLLEFASTFDEMSSKTREELVGIIATGLDLPKEIIVGMADLNHWTAWQVDDNTFRHHVEPHVIQCVDALTGAYLRPYLENCDIDPSILDAWLRRVVLWYDPTELVTHPDQTANATLAWDRLAISDEKYREVLGFGDEDAPTIEEVQLRIIRALRNWPPNLVMEFLHEANPGLVVPPITVAGTIPGIKAEGVDVGPGPLAPPAPGAPTPAATATPPAIAAGPPAAATPATQAGPPGSSLTASVAEALRQLREDGVLDTLVAAVPAPKPSRDTTSKSRRLSRKLASIDQDLRARLQTAANAAMLRQLEKAGGRLRSKVAKDETLRTKIAHTRNEQVAAALGVDVVTAVGLSASELMGNEWDAFRDQYREWTAAAQRAAIAAAAQLAGLTDEDESVTVASAAMAKGLDAGWTLLSNAMTSLAHDVLYNPDPNAADATFNPNTLVPAGTIRASLGVAGGADAGDFGIDTSGNPTIRLGEPIGQVGTGATISDLITGSGAEQANYEWVHGPSLTVFEPHEALDGIEFATFDSDALANAGDWPDNQYFFPGDHNGCTCDFMPIYTGIDDTGSATGDTGDEGEPE